MNPTTPGRRHAYPRTDPGRRPTPWWYYGRALYVTGTSLTNDLRQFDFATIGYWVS